MSVIESTMAKLADAITFLGKPNVDFSKRFLVVTQWDNINILNRDVVSYVFNTDEPVRCCFLGAISVTAYGKMSPEEKNLLSRLSEQMTGLSIVSWNDKVCKSKDELIKLMEKMYNHLDNLRLAS